MGKNNHICRCGKRKNEFDMYFVTIMCLIRDAPDKRHKHTNTDR